MLKLSGITKRFPGVLALSDVSFQLNPGEVHVLFGENGAGKSTLVNIMIGNYRPDAGTYLVDGAPLRKTTPAEAHARGVGAVFQEFSLASTLSVLDNIWLGRELTRFGRLDRPRMRALAEEQLARMQMSLPLDTQVDRLTRAEKQQAEITKAMLQNTRYMIFDEPTASLADVEANNVLRLIRELRDQDVGIVYISHRMREVRAVADRVSVLRNGQYIGTLARSEIEEQRLVSMMTGRKVDELFPTIPYRDKSATPADVLTIRHLATASGGVKDVSLHVRAGEVVGLAGLIGCGKSRVGRACFGLEPITAGTLLLNGQPVTPGGPAEMLDKHVCYFPSDRATEGLCLNRPIVENVTMSDLDTPEMTRNGLLDLHEERRRARSVSDRLRVSATDLSTRVEMLSGGNKQKVLLARGLSRSFDLFIFDEPTVGVDIGAKAEIYQLIKQLCEDGSAVLMISSDLEEVVHMSHRIYALHEGVVVDELTDDRKTPEQVLASFFGHREQAPEAVQ